MGAAGPSDGAAARSGASSSDWTIEVRRLDQGTFRAFVVELPTCVGRGETRGQAVADAERALSDHLRDLDARGKTPPRAVDSPSRLSVRIPRSLHGRLVRRAEVEGVSLNLVISSALSEFVGRGSEQLPGDFPPAGEELRMAVWRNKRPAQTSASIESVEAIIRSVEDRRGTNLGLLLRALLADRILAVEGEQAASRHLGRAARVAADAGDAALAGTFWEASIAIDNDNAISPNAYGQFLFEQGRYEEAIPLLKLLEDSDLPWSTVVLRLCELGMAVKEKAPTAEAARAAVEALKKSTSGKPGLAHRRAWVRYARALKDFGVSTAEIEGLVARARAYGEWTQPVQLEEVVGRPDPVNGTPPRRVARRASGAVPPARGAHRSQRRRKAR